MVTREQVDMYLDSCERVRKLSPILRDFKSDGEKIARECLRMREALENVRATLGDFQEPWNNRERAVDEIARQALSDTVAEALTHMCSKVKDHDGKCLYCGADVEDCSEFESTLRHIAEDLDHEYSSLASISLHKVWKRREERAKGVDV